MRILILIISAFLFVCSCSKKQMQQEDIALQAAKVYYDHLLQGNYDAFIDGVLRTDTLPSDYRTQLRLNLKQYIETAEKENKGISRVEALRAKCDTLKLSNDSNIITAQAFIAICYNDSTREEVVVPMVYKAGIWYLR